jgi:hypothetical protein
MKIQILDENPRQGLALVSNACIFANLMNIQFEKDIPEKSKFGQENNRDHRSFN